MPSSNVDNPLRLPFGTVTYPSRALGTVYQNTQGTYRLVIASIAVAAGTIAIVRMDTTATPSTILVSSGNLAALVPTIPFTFIVPPGWYYSITNATGGIQYWAEYS